MDLNAQQNEKWLRKRKLTFIAFSIQLIIIGIEYTLTLLTLWLYIKEMINTNSPKLLYSVVSVSFMLASTIVMPFIGRIVDKYRNIKSCFLLCNLLMLTGNVLYSIPFSPAFLVAGRIVAGFGGSLKSVIFSETIRCYPASETSSKLSVLSVMHNLGFMLGPGINFFFKDMSFFIGRWHLLDVNFPGLFMGFVCIAMEILTLTMVHDVSKEFDYKALLENNDATDIVEKVIFDKNSEDVEKIPIVRYNNESNYTNVGDEKSNYVGDGDEKSNYTGDSEILLPLKSKKHAVLKILKVLFLHFDSALILFTNFVIAFFFITADIWLPLLVIEKMHLSILEMNISFFGVSGICALMLLLFIWKPVSDKNMIILLIISLVGFCIVSTGFIVLSYFPFNKALNVVLCIIYMVSFGGAPIIVDVFFVNTLSKMVKSNILTFVDSIRYSMFSAGAFLGFIFSPFMFDYVITFGTMYITVMIIIGIMFTVRNKHFINPKLLF
ncbi:uncharacterized protein LOC124818587 isoform X1 [Hydra vulgaris]|uniref:uncharacterized protein LOC124818587 isoform X1 n=1 Tax=Hydra vulgaris TaxID=6087 RepID=UPI001F5E46B9|nr:uncharacterized protein LOC124818587 [Hydra vulgaris]XP_047145551.1 uncharacterized protein LOC124818587 [Hydra vulgaris]